MSLSSSYKPNAGAMAYIIPCSLRQVNAVSHHYLKIITLSQVSCKLVLHRLTQIHPVEPMHAYRWQLKLESTVQSAPGSVSQSSKDQRSCQVIWPQEVLPQWDSYSALNLKAAVWALWNSKDIRVTLWHSSTRFPKSFMAKGIRAVCRSFCRSTEKTQQPAICLWFWLVLTCHCFVLLLCNRTERHIWKQNLHNMHFWSVNIPKSFHIWSRDKLSGKKPHNMQANTTSWVSAYNYIPLTQLCFSKKEAPIKDFQWFSQFKRISESKIQVP